VHRCDATKWEGVCGGTAEPPWLAGKRLRLSPASLVGRTHCFAYFGPEVGEIMTSWRPETDVGTRRSRSERLVDVRKAVESRGEILGQRSWILTDFSSLELGILKGVQISIQSLTGNYLSIPAYLTPHNAIPGVPMALKGNVGIWDCA
jgi:hypothetical protein